MGFLFRIVLLGAAVGLIGGCRGHETLWQLELAGLDTGVVEPGESLELSGRGFPAGRSGELALVGELRAPGRPSRSISWRLRSEARSAERVSAVLDAKALQEVARFSTFSGHAVLRFAVNDRLSVAGRLDGVSIEWSGEEGTASARRGDTSQLDAPPTLGAGFGGLGYLLWVCPAALALLFLGPWPRPVELLYAGVSQLRERRLRLFRVSDVGGAGASQVSPALVVTSAAVCSLAAWQASRLTLTAALAVYAGIVVLRCWSFERSFRMSRAGTGLFAPTALLGVALGCTAALSGGQGLSELAAEQGAMPSGWNLFARPPVWLAAFAWWQCAVRLHPATTCSPAQAQFDNLGRVLLAASTAAVFLGGPSGASSMLAPSLQLGLNSALFALKTLAVLWALALLQPLGVARLRVVVGSLLALATLAAAWLWAMPSRLLELRVGTAVLVTLALAGLVSVFEYAWHRRRPSGATTAP